MNSRQKFMGFIVASWRLLIVRYHLWKFGAPWIEVKLQTNSRSVDSTTVENDFDLAQALFNVVAFAARFQYRSSACLPRSIVLYDLLRQDERLRDLVQLKIGVNKTSETLSSHAWVELDGEMVGEPDSVGRQYVGIEQASRTNLGYNKKKVAKPNTEK